MSNPPSPPDPILKTKLFIPRLRQQVLPRPRLIEQMEASLRRKLTLVSAPAGYGKTTLLAEFAHKTKNQGSGVRDQGPVPCSLTPDPCFSWVSLDADDNDPIRFLTYLIAALDQIGVIGEETRALPVTAQSLPPQSILVRLLSDLESSPQPLVLVLDDYHVIQSPSVHALLSYWLEHMPEAMRLVIATRADPPVPLARLRAGGELAELRAEDLRFTVEETSRFLTETMGLSVRPEEVAALEARTEGWIVGLQMAALSMRDRQDVSGFVRAFSGSNRFVLDYLAEEVVSRQPEHVQSFLLQTSILDRVCASLVDALLESRESRIESRPQDQASSDDSRFSTLDSRSTLEYLDRSNLFLVPLDDQREWYRYHHLFAELLRVRLVQTAPEQVPQLHRRAAGWFEQNGMVVEAVQHALDAKDYALAADWIERYGHERWSFSDRTFLLLTGKLPLEMLQTRPRLGIYHAWTQILFARLDTAETLLRAMAEHLPSGDPDPETRALRSFIDLLLIYLASLTGKQAAVSLPGREVLDFVPEGHLAMRNTADVVYAILLSLQGRFREVEEILTETIRRDTAAGGTTAVPIAVAFMARLSVLQGRLHAAARLCREYIQVVESRGAWMYYIPGNLHIALGNILREWNDLPGAEDTVRKGIRLNELWNIPLSNSIGCTALARIQFSKGDVDEALETMAKLEQMNQGRLIAPDVIGDQEALLVKLWLAKGDLDRLAEWARAQPPLETLDYVREQTALSLARVTLAQGKFAEAQDLLTRLSSLAEAGGRFGRQMEIALLLALAFQGLQRQAQAFQALEACLRLAQPEGWTRLFLDEGSRVRDLLGAYLRSSSADCKPYAQHLLDAFGAGAAASSPVGAGELVEPLTPREAEVLALICEGLSNQEIAGRLVITISAVKKHTGNIFGKLGVSSRTQAIARARQLGMGGKEM